MSDPLTLDINDPASCVGGLTSHELKTRYSDLFENVHTGTNDRIDLFIKSSFEIFESINSQLQSMDNRMKLIEASQNS
jgi:hypothetical protein